MSKKNNVVCRLDNGKFILFTLQDENTKSPFKWMGKLLTSLREKDVPADDVYSFADLKNKHSLQGKVVEGNVHYLYNVDEILGALGRNLDMRFYLK